MNKHIHIKKKYRRIIAISDIHGHFSLMLDAFEKIGVTEDDLLIILGDCINRGYESLKVFRYIQKLHNTKNNVMYLKGNHEEAIQTFLTDKEYQKKVFSFLKKGYDKTIFSDYLKELDVRIDDISSYEELSKLIIDSFEEDLLFMRNLPLTLRYQHFLFAHSGISTDKNYLQNEKEILSNNNFYYDKHTHDFVVVYGHMPVCNLRDNCFNNEILIDENKNIIAIDGGLGVKEEGELNALVINIDKTISFSKIVTNDFVSCELIEDSIEPKSSCNKVFWPDFEIDVIEEGHVFSTCLRTSDNNKLKVFTKDIVKNNNKTYLKRDFIDCFFTIKKGTVVDFIKEDHDGYALVKFYSKLGFVKRNLLREIR